MKQTSTLTRTLASAQEHHARSAALALSTFRLYVEDTFTDGELSALIGRYFSAHTSWIARGSWMGAPEQSRVIEIVARTSEAKRVQDLADLIRRTVGHECVMMTESSARVRMVTANAVHIAKVA